ncbi:MAG: hypothetical protein COV96_02450 [Candidatus Zambryskibacteria bacterium CG11_big_fil_rev_8_21_14_0_20_42_18]|uniref:Uncharacterized protein n=1 Tax=Candidatus Zambryskibacteria bacterium CG_4_9_14_3_um_filter_42_15 TaxID=1975112 RepID=A0A2M7WS98_9BACT|nr:MAG: hypothetical protein COV96_02450 [Candidatus Zambryskibacteria bacterium CG11_big_fil_rev_8_21_14_0_20_42_18]PJA32879.1 MAG: hypothetical protein CO185_01375 [Candidatus Zambryskibacteria bacterium CG_4_9_14_3_um_filter_42_15]
MKKHLTRISTLFFTFVLVFIVGGFLFPQTTRAVECTTPGFPAGCTQPNIILPPTDLGGTNTADHGSKNTTDPGSTNTTNGNGSITLNNPFNGSDSLFELLKSIMNNIVLPIGGVLAVLAFIYSGFLYVTAQGDESQLKTAHRALLYTSIGTAVLLGSWVLANVICQTIGLLGGPACAT